MRELHLFAGIGGGILGGMLLGHRCVGAVEIDPYCRRVLEARQRDGILEPFPIHDDIKTFDGTAWRGRVDVVCGGFPCQDISSAGDRAGLDGRRSGLWWEMHRVIREVAPRFVFVENVADLLIRGFDRVLGSLADLGFDAEWCVLSAADVGAPHLRKRLWLLAMADSDRPRLEGRHGAVLPQRAGECAAWASGASDVPDADREQRKGCASAVGRTRSEELSADAHHEGEHAVAVDAEASRAPQPLGRGRWWQAEPPLGRVADGIPDRVGQLRALGNAQVPAVAAAAFQILMREHFAPEVAS